MLTFPSARHIHRVDRAGNSFSLPDWKYAPFLGRFDDPDQTFRCLYGAEQRYGAYVEQLQRYRPDLTLLRQLGEIADAAPMNISTSVPSAFFTEYRISKARVDVPADNGLVDLTTASGLAAAHAPIEAATRRSGVRITDYTAATLLEKNTRALTRALSRVIYEHGFAGIAYRSCYDVDAVCIALFENRYKLAGVVAATIVPTDPDFIAASAIHHLGVVIDASAHPPETPRR